MPGGYGAAAGGTERKANPAGDRPLRLEGARQKKLKNTSLSELIGQSISKGETEAIPNHTKQLLYEL